MKTFALPADGPARRLYIISLFTLLQALKLYDFLTLRTASNPGLLWFFIKWTCLDSVFVYVLPYLNIPWLQFRRSVQILQIAMVLVLNWGLSYGWEIIMESGLTLGIVWNGLVKVFYHKELGITEKYVDVGKLLHNSSHIQGGTKKIRILPESTAKINPAGKPFCFRPKQTDPLTIPIRLNGTIPILIQYSHTTFSDPPVVHHHDILSKNLKSMLDHAELSEEPGEEGLQILPLQISEQGAYKLERVVDKTGNEVRVYRSEAIVVECPSAEISSFNDLQTHFCQGESDALKFHVRGVPPLHLTYSQEVNGHAITIPIDSIKPESFSLPFTQGGLEIVQHRYEHVDYTFAQAHPITLTYPLALDVVGHWDYTLLEVKDAFGNLIHYKGRPPGYRIAVHELPKIQFRGCSEDSPTKLLKGRDSNLHFNVHTTEQGPFNVTLAYTAESSDTQVLNTYEIQHKRDSLSISTPGMYSIVNVTSRYCPGDVLTPQSCLVITPAEPTLQIDWSTLKDHCSGTVGVTADLTFTGEPPFYLSYRVLSRATGTHEVKRFKVDRTRHQMDFRPDVAGTYVYEFITVDDANYRYIEFDGAMYGHEATIHPLPGARFADLSARKTCIGSSLTVPVRLIGSGPWNLTYDVGESGAKRKSMWTTVQVPDTWLELPDFTKGGKATVSLRSVTDGSGCTVQLGEDDLVVDVRREKPSARFYTTGVTGRDGDTVKLPLRLTGEGPWVLRYAHVDAGGQRVDHDVMVNDPNGFIESRSDGVYELIAVADSTCPGVIKSGHERFEVTWIGRPKLDIIGFEGIPLHEIHRLDDICAGEDAFLDLTLHGVKPFTVDYNILKLDEKDRVISRSKEELSAAMSTAQIRLRTDDPGKYQYEFTHLSDAVYDDLKNLGNPIRVEHQILALPTAKFADTQEPHVYCADTSFDDPKSNGIPIAISASSPVTIKLALHHELQPGIEYVELTDITEKVYYFVPKPGALTHGLHVLTILSVHDTNGCATHPTTNNRASYAVADEASILPLEPQQHHCVGDRISYSLQGTSPWHIEYEFNGKRNLAKTANPTFSRIAEKMGDLSIVSVADRASTCKTFIPKGKMVKFIHDVPSVSIAGSNKVENIREGDQAEIQFEFFGVPPFSMTLRLSPVANKKGKKLKLMQMHTINNIQGYTHSFFTSQEGDYEVVSLQDRYCRYPRDDGGSAGKAIEY